MKKLTILLSASLFALVLPACTTVMTAGVKKGDERNFARSLNDVNASRAIKARMGRVEGFQLSGVDVEVAEGIVVLSGNVPRDEDRIEAERIAWSGPAVVQVGNEIQIKGKQGLVRNTKDGILNQAVRARLIATKSVKARNFNIEVNDGVVYLLGVARTPEELAQAAHIASTTKGTTEVISYVRLAGDNSRLSASGPGFNGEPSLSANQQNYQPLANAPLTNAPLGNVGNPAPQAYSNLGTGTQSAELPPLPSEPSIGAPTAPSVGLDNDAIESGEPYYRDPKTGERIILPEGVKPIPYVPDTGPGSLGAGAAPLPPQAGAYNIDPLTGDMVPVHYSPKP